VDVEDEATREPRAIAICLVIKAVQEIAKCLNNVFVVFRPVESVANCFLGANVSCCIRVLMQEN
jgi:hypothetical protein